MSGKSTKATCHPLTSSVEVSPAKTSAKPEKGQGWMVTAPGCTSKCTALFASCGPDFGSWRTSQLLLTGGLMLYSGPWPRQGMMLGGDVYAFPTWVHHINVKGGSAQVGWPSHSASVHNYGQSVESHDRKRERLRRKYKNGNGCGRSLSVEAVRHSSHQGKLNPDWVEVLQGFPLGWTLLTQDG